MSVGQRNNRDLDVILKFLLAMDTAFYGRS